jgi:osmotically-inducible protein OsmY
LTLGSENSLKLKTPKIMADNRNWDEQRSNEWNESGNRYGNDRNEDQNRYRSRNEGYGNSDSNRSRQDDYKRDENRYGSEYDQNRNSGNFGSRSDFNRTSRRGDNWGSSYGDAFDTYMDYNRQNRGGANDYRSSYGSGSDYSGGNYGGMYGNSYGNRSRSEGYGGGFGFGERTNFGDRDNDRNYNYGSYRDRQRGDYSRGHSSEYNRNRPGNDERTWWDRTSDEVSSWFGDEEAERRRRQDRTQKGRGPKNYQRSDERIKEDINDRLSDDWFIDASEVDVTVSGGEVTLAGTVDDRSDKRRAEDIAESVSGVKHVENRLRVSSLQNQNTSSGSYATTPGATSIGTGSGSGGTSGAKSKSSYADTK